MCSVVASVTFNSILSICGGKNYKKATQKNPRNKFKIQKFPKVQKIVMNIKIKKNKRIHKNPNYFENVKKNSDNLIFFFKN